MGSWTIVAIPRADDPVWKLSSEKIPHMTLLFLGEQSEPAKAVRITEYLQHAIETSLSNFGATVDRRGILGRDQADVLFFEDTLLGRIKEFRSYLLKNDDISESYHSTEQFPKWTPHLTLGYPKTPARTVVGRDFDPTYVEFDRIAFWIEDFDGPEFRLKTPKPIAQKEMRMTSLNPLNEKGGTMETNTDDFLEHYGIKGMKWGVRREPGPDGTVSGKLAARKEKRQERKNARKKARRENWERPRSEDARTTGSSRQRAKRHGTDALSNKELQSLVNRMNLEQQYTNLQESGKAQSARKAGQAYMSDILKDAGKELATEAIKWGVREAAKSATNRASTSRSTTRTATRTGQKALPSGRRRLNR